MTKIFDLVNFHAAYGEQVRLLDYYYDPNENREHMAGYVPIRAHRDAFLDLARSQLPSKENKEKVFMLTGSYGTGKSHLCLMLANYFSLKPTDLEMAEFFDNWAKRDAAGANNVRNWRGDGRYLVAPCDFARGQALRGHGAHCHPEGAGMGRGRGDHPGHPLQGRAAPDRGVAEAAADGPAERGVR